jgi:hypothetical protein
VPGTSTERFDIFIERPTDTSPDGRERLVRAMASRFGIEDRLLRGPLSTGRRLRAKANVDEAQAAKIVRELEALGAIVTVSRHNAAAPRISQEMPLIHSRPSGPVSMGTDPPSSGFAKMPSLTLATLDGEDAEPAPPPPLSAELTAPPRPLPPPPPGLPRPPSPSRSAVASPSTSRPAVAAPSAQRPLVSSPPSASRPAVTFTAPSTSGAHNAFAPPSDENEAPLELAIVPPRPGTLAPPAPALHEPPPKTLGKSSKVTPSPELPRDSAERTVVRPSIVDLATRDPRGRFAAGLVLGLGLGFLPAHVYASFAEEKLDEIGLAMAREPAPQTEAEYQLLMQQFDLAEGRSRRVKARIMVIAGAVWLLAGAGAAYGYWRIMESRQLARAARDA